MARCCEERCDAWKYFNMFFRKVDLKELCMNWYPRVCATICSPELSLPAKLAFEIVLFDWIRGQNHHQLAAILSSPGVCAMFRYGSIRFNLHSRRFKHLKSFHLCRKTVYLQSTHIVVRTTIR